MSTELSNGVIIPEEYSDDWYDEMSINLRKLNDVITAASDNATDIQRLDTAKANQSDLTALGGRVTQNETDITALQTAVSGALKREIVQTLPTEDISTTTIYMIRNSQSSGTNIYDEYMYINSQWELIGTSATDFSNYYTKTEIDTLLSYKASDSDVVHKRGNETVGGSKTFSDNLTIYNPDNTVTPKGLTIRNAQWGMGESGGTTVSSINFLDKNSSVPVSIMASKGVYGQSFLRFAVRTKDSQNNTYLEEIYYNVDTSGNFSFRAWHDNMINLGTSAYKWKDVQTYKVNALEPSSLSLPSDRSARIDISSYITNLGNGDNNSYTVPANGYIWLHFTSVNSVLCYSQTSGGLTNYAQTFTRYQGDGQLYAFFPIRKDDKCVVQIYTSSTAVVQNAYFIPCQGNI